MYLKYEPLEVAILEASRDNPSMDVGPDYKKLHELVSNEFPCELEELAKTAKLLVREGLLNTVSNRVRNIMTISRRGLVALRTYRSFAK